MIDVEQTGVLRFVSQNLPKLSIHSAVLKDYSTVVLQYWQQQPRKATTRRCTRPPPARSIACCMSCYL
jgi:hypothetical protein